MITKLKDYISSIWSRPRLVSVVLEDDSIRIRSYRYLAEKNTFIAKKEFNLVIDSSFSKIILDAYFLLVYFPFPYQVIVSSDGSRFTSRLNLISGGGSNLSDDFLKSKAEESWRIFEKNKQAAIKNFTSDDLEVLLGGVFVFENKNNKDKILAGLLETFTPRNLFSKISKLIKSKRIASFNLLERGIALPVILAINQFAENHSGFLFFYVSPKNTKIFIFNKGEVYFYDQFDWGSDGIILEISEKLSISEEVSQRIIESAVRGEVSNSFNKFITSLLKKEVGFFENAVKMSSDNTKLNKTFFYFGELEDFFETSQSIKKNLIKSNDFLPFNFYKENNNSQVDLNDFSEIFLSLVKNNKSKVARTMIQPIRWLIPGNILKF